ncbi:MAG: HlyD family efflux transporter periplasmic adaptor subunit [Ferruginibacter sp.]|nr:HlyD family efflux transporter periplasmic adaptor subunit [Ferruginibacter sp.]
MIVPYNIHNSISYLAEIKRNIFSIYWFIVLISIASATALPFIKIDISVKSPGIIRPVEEKTELKSSISTVIDTIYYKEGDTLQQGDIIIQLHKENITIKKTMNDFEINQRNKFIADLSIITGHAAFSNTSLINLQSPVYKQQYSRFIFQLSELNAGLKKVNKEMYIDSLLSIDRIITPKEMFDKQIEQEKLIANIKATREQQLATWQQELARYQLEKSQFENANQQLNEDSNFYSIRAPASGVLQSFNKYYQGSLVQAGEVLAVISPQAELIAECYINTRDVGLLKQQQQTLFQVDAFDYNYFGILTGKILSIDNDYTVMDDRPVFKVRCILDRKQLHLKNGFTGDIKKGMTVQARFVIAKRSLWQLLYDKIDDWVNPLAP